MLQDFHDLVLRNRQTLVIQWQRCWLSCWALMSSCGWSHRVTQIVSRLVVQQCVWLNLDVWRCCVHNRSTSVKFLVFYCYIWTKAKQMSRLVPYIFGNRHYFYFSCWPKHRFISNWTVDSKAVSWTGVGYSFIISTSIRQVKVLELILSVPFTCGSCCCEPTSRSQRSSPYKKQTIARLQNKTNPPEK